MSQAVPKCPHCQEGLPCITPGLDSSLSLFSARTCPLSHQERGERRFRDVPRWLRVSFPAADAHLDVDAGASLLVSSIQSTSGRHPDSLLPHVALWRLVDTPSRRPGHGNVQGGTCA